MSNSSQPRVSRAIPKIILWFSTIASLLFFGWAWLLFLPINIFGKMAPIFEWLGEMIPNPALTVLFFLLLALIYFGGVFVTTQPSLRKQTLKVFPASQVEIWQENPV